ARELAQRCRGDEPALLVALLGPGIGKQDEGARDLSVGQPAQEGARVVRMQADVGELLPFDGAQRLDDAVLERLAADQADVRIGSRLPEQMLGSADTVGTRGNPMESLRCRRTSSGARTARPGPVERLAGAS